MIDRGHAAVEFAMAVAVLMLPVALVVTAFGPWSERRVFAEAAAAEAARAAVLNLDETAGVDVVAESADGYGLDSDLVRVAWCGSTPGPLVTPSGVCPMSRGSTVSVVVEVWAPLITTPWGPVGGIWVSADHTEPIDLYRSLP